MKLTLMRVAHKTPGFRQLARRIHPAWFFRLSLWSVTLSSFYWPHTKKLARPFREVLRDSFDPKELSVRARRYLLYLRLFKELELAWNNWENRHADWITVDGESYLKKALQEGRGAILVSCHNYGFSKIVAPALALRGYKVHRGGGGKKNGRRVSRWGKNYRMGWRYLDYKGDYWHRLQLLKTMQAALAENDIVHVSPRAYWQGEEEMAVDLFGRKYFLDATWFRFFEMCRAPVLPCFAVGNTDGQIRIVLHSALSLTAKEMVTEFAEIQRNYLTRYPEFGRLWKDVYLSREKW
jgi:lauroyl/myristoyl acyltransferase